jgi:hypothetical protein
MKQLRGTPAKRVAALLATAAVAAGLGASPVSAAPPGKKPPAHAGCMWGGDAFSHGSTHDEPHARTDGKTDWVQYECVDGVWVAKGYWTTAKPASTTRRAPAAPPGGQQLAPPRR